MEEFLAEGTSGWRTAGIWVIALAVGGAALYFGRDFFVPVAFGALLAILFRPIVRVFDRARVPTPIGAAIVTLALLGLMVFAGWLLSSPIQSWINSAPQRFEQAHVKLNRLRRPVEKVQDIARRLEHAAAGPTSQNAAEAPPPPGPVQSTSTVSNLAGATTRIAGEIVEVLVLMYLLLASGRLFVQKLVKVTPGFHDKQVALRIIEETQSVVAQYLTVTAIINIVQGTLVGVILWWIGMPSPFIWGALTMVLEFVPYLGAAVMVALLSITAFATFDHMSRILAAPGAYLIITTIQNNLVSPYAYGNRLKLNPVAVLVGVLLWWFLWGTPGAFLAVPIVATTKVLADRVEHLKPLGEFLGD